MGKRELVSLLSLSSWCLKIVVWLFLAVPWVCLQFVIVVFPDHTHLLFRSFNKQTWDLNMFSIVGRFWLPLNVKCVTFWWLTS